MITAIAGAAILSLTAADPVDLTLIHGEEAIVSWLEVRSVRREGDLARARVLRIRGRDQAFWLVEEIDCAARTSGLVRAYNISEDGSLPTLDGPARQSRPSAYDRFGRAVIAAVCDGARPYRWSTPVSTVAQAIAAVPAARIGTVRDRPLELVVVRPGDASLFMNRATLYGGGPQWEVRSLRLDARARRAGTPTGTWSVWEFDCDSWMRTADLQLVAPLQPDGTAAPGDFDQEGRYAVVAGSDEAVLLDAVCADDIWTRPAYPSIRAAQAAARVH